MMQKNLCETEIEITDCLVKTYHMWHVMIGWSNKTVILSVYLNGGYEMYMWHLVGPVSKWSMSACG